MSLITAMDEVEREIGKKRARNVAEFRRLVDERQNHEAKEYLENASSTTKRDIRRYAGIHLRQLQTSGL